VEFDRGFLAEDLPLSYKKMTPYRLLYNQTSVISNKSTMGPVEARAKQDHF